MFDWEMESDYLGFGVWREKEERGFQYGNITFSIYSALKLPEREKRREGGGRWRDLGFASSCSYECAGCACAIAWGRGKKKEKRGEPETHPLEKKMLNCGAASISGKKGRSQQQHYFLKYIYNLVSLWGERFNAGLK